MGLHQTKIRPATEPYEFHRARQRAQQRDLKLYLLGKPVWISMYIKDLRTGLVMGPPGKYETERVKIQGTYRTPLCPMCNLKEKKATKKRTDVCRCAELLR